MSGGGYQKVAGDEELTEIQDAENNKTTSEKLTVRYSTLYIITTLKRFWLTLASPYC